MDQQSPALSPKQKLRALFFSTLYISAFTFGGGFVIVTFMKRKFVDQLHWITEAEMLDMAALAQSSPGAVVGTIIPPMVILSIISFFYAAFATNPYVALMLKGMQAGVAAVILDVVCGLGGAVVKTKSAVYIALMAAAFVANFFFDVNVILIILVAAAFGVVRALFQQRKAAQK